MFLCEICFTEHLRWLFLKMFLMLNACIKDKVLGGDYMIPFGRNEILSRFAGIPVVL